MAKSSFPEKLNHEFEGRRENNSRYSLRAFAAFLGTDHSTLSQILRGKRPISPNQVRKWCEKLSLTEEETSVYVAALYVPDASTTRRQVQLRHWTAEAMAIVNDRIHWHILQLVHSQHFRVDCRWIAAEIGATVDQVNLALTRLLRLRLLEMPRSRKWRSAMGRGQLTETDFRKAALIRIRELAAGDGIRLRHPEII
jgi:transcriptional regulator with XRE-family HTH domain